MYPQIFSTLVALVVYLIAFVVMRKLLKIIGGRKNVPQSRIFYISKYFHFLILTITLIAMAFIWSFDFSGLLVLASSIFAVVGIALFAQWSIINNITASVIMFLISPIRVGDKVKIIDGDNTVGGRIKDITLFQISMEDDEGNLISYPNNLILQKPVVKFRQAE